MTVFLDRSCVICYSFSLQNFQAPKLSVSPPPVMPSFSLHLPSPLSSSVPRTKKQKPHSGIPHSSLSITRIVDRPFPAAAKNIVVTESLKDLVNGITKPDSALEEEEEEEEDSSLPNGLRLELMPNHVAVIMDGNRRWAQMRGLPVGAGYEAGVRALKGLLRLCCKWSIRVLTVFAFSADNWFRPKVEVDFLMGLFEMRLQKELETFMRDDIRISVIGDTSKLPRNLRGLISNAEKLTAKNSGLHLVVAVNYSGQYDLVQACRRISQKVKDGLIEAEDIDELMMEQELDTKCTDCPRPDLLIRTSGELRISNFFLWQLAYTELFFTQSFWPEFGETEFIEALCSFQQRQRRYGGRL